MKKLLLEAIPTCFALTLPCAVLASGTSQIGILRSVFMPPRAMRFALVNCWWTKTAQDIDHLRDNFQVMDVNT
jgi:hypothetical protein